MELTKLFSVIVIIGKSALKIETCTNFISSSNIIFILSFKIKVLSIEILCSDIDMVNTSIEIILV